MRGSSIVLLLISGLAYAEDIPLIAPVDHAREFVQTYCIDCHNEENPSGKTNLAPLLPQDIITRDVLTSVYDQLHLDEMPPEEEDQPSEVARKRMLSFLRRTIGASGPAAIDKKSLPGYGNYVDHKALFESELTDTRPAVRSLGKVSHRGTGTPSGDDRRIRR